MSTGFCTACGTPAGVDARFCGQCGTALVAAPGAGSSMVAAASPPPPIRNFDPSRPPTPGTPVPDDCIWARYPHPGPIGHRLRGSVLQKVHAMSPATGRTYREVRDQLGYPASQEMLTGEARRVTWSAWDFWSSKKQSVTLQFDRYGVCAGVVDRNAGGGGGGILLVDIEF